MICRTSLDNLWRFVFAFTFAKCQASIDSWQCRRGPLLSPQVSDKNPCTLHCYTQKYATNAFGTSTRVHLVQMPVTSQCPHASIASIVANSYAASTA